MNAPFIPPKTAGLLAENHPVGTRHQAALKIALSLIGNGLSPEAVFAELRSKFDKDVTDKELTDLINGAVRKKPTPSGYGAVASVGRFLPARQAVKAVKQADPSAHCRWWLSGAELSPDELTGKSPEEIPSEPRQWPDLVLKLLFAENEYINILCRHIVTDGKANPQGSGKSLTPGGWRDLIAEKGVPSAEAGAWMRFNPVKQSGGGARGAITDADVTAYRFMLLESDVLPLPMQLAFYSKIKLPVVLIEKSGGKSAHAWVRVDSPTAADYKETVKRVIDALVPFGFDDANKNPSRLSRLPGAIRKIGASNGGLQQLLWLNPAAKPLTESGLIEFEESLTLPALDEHPMKRVMSKAIERYDELIVNRGKLGVMTGFAEFDHDSGGLKPKQMTVFSGESGAGKSTVALNIVNNAINAGVGVVLFTLEMDEDEIADNIITMNCGINRNCFNTGFFQPGNLDKIADESVRLSKMPLWIEDAPSYTPRQIRQRVLQLKAENKIGLVVVDYCQIISPENPMEPREQQVAGFARALRMLAKESNLPVVVLSQLNDEGKLRESRVLAHEAHNVIGAASDDAFPPTSLTLQVYKGRRIPKKTYVLDFDAVHALLKNEKQSNPQWQNRSDQDA